MNSSPKIKVAISYSWDTEEHRSWVLRLAEEIEAEADIDVTFDMFDLWAGKDVTHFMEQAVVECDRIVIVSSAAYVEKAYERKGGVGYECSIITAELVRDQKQDKFIPVLREGNEVPVFLSSKWRVEAREPRAFNQVVENVLNAIRRIPQAKRPPKREKKVETKKTEPAKPVKRISLQYEPITEYAVGDGVIAPLALQKEQKKKYVMHRSRVSGNILRYTLDGVEVTPNIRVRMDVAGGWLYLSNQGNTTAQSILLTITPVGGETQRVLVGTLEPSEKREIRTSFKHGGDINALPRWTDGSPIVGTLKVEAVHEPIGKVIEHYHVIRMIHDRGVLYMLKPK